MTERSAHRWRPQPAPESPGHIAGPPFGEEPGLAPLDNPFIGTMIPDPKLHQILAVFHRQRSYTKTHAHRPKPTHFLESQRRMPRVGFQQREFLVRHCASFSWQLLVLSPKPRRCEVGQSRLAFPLEYSLNASSARWSSRPAAASRSMS